MPAMAATTPADADRTADTNATLPPVDEEDDEVVLKLSEVPNEERKQSFASASASRSAELVKQGSRYSVNRLKIGDRSQSLSPCARLRISKPPAIEEKNAFKARTGSIAEWYVLDNPPLREGSFGKVYRGTSKDTNNVFAIKCVPFSDEQDFFDAELDISRKLDHPNIIRLYDTIFDDAGSQWHLIMDLCTGGDLFDFIKQRGGAGYIEEPIMARWLFQMIDGIAYCHSLKVCHRDLKPENYMLELESPMAPLRLIDFGLACEFEEGVPMTLQCGTTHYSAPQVLKCSYDEKCDIWSIGIIFYMMCLGRWPFFDPNEGRLASIIAGEPDAFGPDNKERTDAFKYVRGDRVSMINLLKELLCVKAQDRPTAQEILVGNAWMLKAKEKPVNSNKSCCELL